MKIRQIPLKRRLMLITIIAISIMLIIEAVFCFSMYITLSNTIKSSADDTMSRMEHTLEKRFSVIKNITTSVAYSHGVMNMLEDKNYSSMRDLNRYMLDTMQWSAYFENAIIQLFLFDGNGTSYTLAEFSSSFQRTESPYIMANYIYSNPAYLQSTKGRFIYEPQFKNSFVYMLPINNVAIGNGNLRSPYLIAVCATNSLTDIFTNSKSETAFAYVLLDQNGDVILSESQTPKEHIPFTQDVSEMGWRLGAKIPEGYVIGKLFSSNLIVLMINVVLIILFFVNVMIINRSVVHPMNTLIDRIAKIDGGNYLHTTLPDADSEDIQILVININKMLQNIQNVTRQLFETQQSLYETEILYKEATISALQNKLNPHFLYNTLENIKSMAYVDGNMEITNITIALSNILKYSLSDERILTVREEINAVRQYLDIIKIRLRDRIKVHIGVDEDTLDRHMIKMLLQPLVENSIKHGLEDFKEGKLTISIRIAGEWLCFAVEDNGKGIEKDMLEQIKVSLQGNEPYYNSTGKNIGIANLYWRLKYVYGKQFFFTIESEPGRGTKIEIRIPKN